MYVVAILVNIHYDSWDRCLNIPVGYSLVQTI